MKTIATAPLDMRDLGFLNYCQGHLSQRSASHDEEPTAFGADRPGRNLEPFRLTVGQAADALGVSRPHLSNLLNEKAGITPEMAIRLGKALGNDPDFWLRLQRQYDLAQALKTAHKIHVGKLVAA